MNNIGRSMFNHRIDLLDAFQMDTPPELDFIWPGFLAGTVGALVAPGATGKSFWALEAAMQVAGGSDLLGLGKVKCGKVLYLAAEDPPDALVRRVHALGAFQDCSNREAIDQNMTLVPIMGKRLNIMDDNTAKQLAGLAQECRLVVIDTLSRVHGLEENSNGDMARLVSQLEWLAAETGAAVLFLHHISKGSAREGAGGEQQAARGASALIDNARYCGYVAKMSEDEAKGKLVPEDRRSYYLRMGVSKQNYSMPLTDQWLERKEGGVLVQTSLEIERKPKK